MLKLDKNKLAGLKTFDDHLQERYGDENSPERKEFGKRIRDASIYTSKKYRSSFYS